MDFGSQTLKHMFSCNAEQKYLMNLKEKST